MNGKCAKRIRIAVLKMQATNSGELRRIDCIETDGDIKTHRTETHPESSRETYKRFKREYKAFPYHRRGSLFTRFGIKMEPHWQAIARFYGFRKRLGVPGESGLNDAEKPVLYSIDLDNMLEGTSDTSDFPHSTVTIPAKEVQYIRQWLDRFNDHSIFNSIQRRSQ